MTTGVRDIIRIAAGLAGILAGGAVILLTRSAHHPWAVYREALGWPIWGRAHEPLAWLWHSLPSLFHVFSFSLLTAGIAGVTRRRGLFICLFWGIVEIALELGQRYKILAMRAIPDWFEGVPWLDNVEDYFLKGAFDPLDMALAALGAALAYGIMVITDGVAEKG